MIVLTSTCRLMCILYLVLFTVCMQHSILISSIVCSKVFTIPSSRGTWSPFYAQEVKQAGSAGHPGTARVIGQ
jgi:hypothetical protein